MPQTFTQLHYHIVFSTKNREPTITPEMRERVWDYLGGIVRGLGGRPHRIGGTADHVHLFATLPQTQSISDMVRKLKVGSSTWAHETMPTSGLWWQNGYAIFSVSHSGISAVKDYVELQEKHHARRTY